MIPNCNSGNLASVSLNNIIAQLTTDVNALSTTLQVEASSATGILIGHVADGWRMNVRSDGTNMLCVIDPSGLASNPDNPLASAGAGASPERIILQPLSGASTRFQLALYDDAICFLLNNTANTYTQYGFMSGNIIMPNNSNDAASGLDGFGMLGGYPGSAAQQWLATGTTSKFSTMRITPADWVYYTQDVSTLSAMDASTIPGGQVERPDLIGVNIGKVGDTPTTTISATNAYRGGFLKYVRRGTGAAPLSVRPSSDTDQAWLALSQNRVITTTPLKLLWNKTVTP